MRRFSLGLLAAVSTIAVTHSASAADLPYKAPPPAVMAPVVFNWTGFYVGLNAGGSFGNSSVDYAQGPGTFGNPPNDRGVFAASYNFHPDSFIGGGQVGYNFQTGNFVWGGEADIQGRSNQSTSVSHVFNQFQDRYTLTDTQNWFATFRGRLGYAVNNWLIYATGGLAVGRVQHEVFQASNSPIVSRDLSDSNTKAGWTVGAGVEYGFAPHWSVAAEYLYVDLGTDTINGPPGGIFGATSVNFHDRTNIGRAKVNYRF